MSAAFVFAMIAVFFSLGVVFMGMRTGKSAAPKKRDGGSMTSSSSGSDCGPADGSGCDGGGGGGD